MGRQEAIDIDLVRQCLTEQGFGEQAKQVELLMACVRAAKKLAEKKDNERNRHSLSK
jgi:hypothetical protein